MLDSRNKLKIYAYKDSAYLKLIAIEGQKLTNPYELQINPESYTHDHTASYLPLKASEKPGQTTRFSDLSPETISFNFYMDATGAIPTKPDIEPKPFDLTLAIKQFKTLIYTYNGEIHSPNYLKLVWGRMNFRCRLTSMNIDYTLFKPNGQPLRVKITVKFQEFLSPDFIVKMERSSSPDLTHTRTVTAGDTLPLMCANIYGSPDYYLKVAQFNKMTHFRILEVGSTIVFPPLGTA